VWGHNPLVSGPDGEIAAKVRETILKYNPKLIVVDPRRINMLKDIDLWLQIRPGTDCALALSMIHVIIDDELYDKEFVEKWTIGFDKLRKHVQKYTPRWAEEITWIPAEKIREATYMYAQTKPACIEWGVALEHTPNCIQTLRAIALLPALTGNVDIPGGSIFGMHAVRPLPLLYDNLPDEISAKRFGAESFKLLCGPEAVIPSAHIPTLLKAMIEGKPYPVKAFLIFGSNALVSYANSKQVYDALKSLEFLVVMDIYMTPTAELADIVLPAATWLEVDQIVAVPFFAENFVLAQQKLIEVEECRQDEWVMIELSRRLNLKVNTEPLEDLLNYQLEPLGITFNELKEKGYVYVPQRYKKYEEQGFKTPSGKVELYSTILEKLGYEPLPVYVEPPESPISTPWLAKDYPLILITGGRTPFFFHSEYRQIPTLRKMHPDPIVEIHPETAAKIGVKDGEWVFIETPRGRIKQRVKITPDIHPKVVHVEHGWWFPEKGPPDYGVWESNANLLTSNAPPYDPAMGTYQLRALLCRVYRADG
jgi:anaerobic selenocysteine-containing dehydrogenase